MLKRFAIRFAIILVTLFFVAYAALWATSFKKYPVSFGISFSPEYATSLGLDWKETYLAMLNDLKPKYIRLAIPWSRVEANKNSYRFEDIDYMMNEASKHDVKVLLAFGQKVPRWPECYIPDWIKTTPANNRKGELLSYIEKVIGRYKNNSALELWQVENEPFIKFDFGDCQVFDKNSIAEEVTLVKKLDTSHKVVLTDSGELSTWQDAAKMSDVLGVTMYRTVRTPGGFIVNYGLVPAAFYKVRAFMWGKDYNDFFVSELQAEPWFTNGTPTNTSIEVQEQTASIDQLSKNISYAQYVGASRAYLWGVEWWYWMKTKQSDSKYWNEVKGVLEMK